MKRAALVSALSALVVASCGGGSVAPVVGTETLGKHHGEAGAGKLHVADLLTNLADTKAAAVLCLKPSVLIENAGSGLKIGGPAAKRRRARAAITDSLAPTLFAELRRGDRLAVSIVQHRLNLVKGAVVRGLAQARQDPKLLIERKVPGFEEAAALADRYGLSTC
jgi:hypothetical protein